MKKVIALLLTLILVAIALIPAIGCDGWAGTAAAETLSRRASFAADSAGNTGIFYLTTGSLPAGSVTHLMSVLLRGIIATNST